MLKQLVYFDADRNEIRMVDHYNVKRVYHDCDGLVKVEIGGRCKEETLTALDVAWLELDSYGNASLESASIEAFVDDESDCDGQL